MTDSWRGDIRAWGRVVAARHHVSHPATTQAAAALVAGAGPEPILAFGCGRSYGDVALNPDGRLLEVTSLDRFIAFDPATGLLTCEAGVRLADILALVCRPEPDGSGWFLPVTPGTRFVTIGGAIANDVHGKNHHVFGTFGRHLISFDIIRSDGQVRTCSPNENAALFAATIGGLGLTGLILRATLRLRRVAGLAMEAQDIRFDRLEDFFNLAAASDRDWEYTAAWVDCSASGRNLGRGIYSRARHAPGQSAAPAPRQPKLSLPIVPPLSLANGFSVRAFNALYVRKLGHSGRSARTGGYESVLYPLDGLGNWNRIYGPRGFYQFQCVVPFDTARQAIAEMLRLIAASGQGSMLSVLKTFADLQSPGLLSFPRPGATLALDFPNKGPATRRLMQELEHVALQAGGRLYPAKDGLMSMEAFQKGFPAWETFQAHIDPAFSSSFARRVGLVTKSPGATPFRAIAQPGTAPMKPDLIPRKIVAIFGATSDIAEAVARRYAEAGASLLLVGRDTVALDRLAADLVVRGAPDAAVQHADFADTNTLPAVAAQAWERFGRIDIALLAYGTLPDQAAVEEQVAQAGDALLVNFTSPVLLLGALAQRFQAQRSGMIAVISSVAGDRGRKSNYVYGAAKGGLQHFLEGLRHRLHQAGVGVLDIRPGFVTTKMTSHLSRGGPLWASADKVAADIVQAVTARKAVVYTPWFWRWVMLIVRSLPRMVFHRTSL